LLTNYQQSIDINNQVIAQAEADAPLSGYETKSYFVIPTRDSGLVDIADASNTLDDASIDDRHALDASIILNSPNRDLYVGYLTGDSKPPVNAAKYSFGIEFPANPETGEFFLRSDYLPNRLFRHDGKHWVAYENNVRMTLNNFGAEDLKGQWANNTTRQTLKGGFINNTTTATIAGNVVQERQALSKALRAKADNS
jgi:hypothetical protein